MPGWRNGIRGRFKTCCSKERESSILSPGTLFYYIFIPSWYSALMGTRQKYTKKDKNTARRLRKKGLSYGEITRRTGIAKSTLSLWLKYVSLSSADKKRLYSKQVKALSLGSRSQHARREHEVNFIIQEAKKEIGISLSTESLRLMGAALYWAEGSKRARRVQITNSDPHLILFSVIWIEKVFGISADDLRARLNIYSRQNDNAIKTFWSDLTGIPVKNFGKSYIKPSGKGFKKNNLYYGTIRIEVPKSADLLHKIFGWIQASLESLAPKTTLVQQKWVRLEKIEEPANLR